MQVVTRAVMPRPRLWCSAAAAVVRLAKRGWWRRAPFLPLPGDAYWQFRLVTAYGGDGNGPGVAGGEGEKDKVLREADVVAFLEWCQRSRPSRG
jgi:hypothetical protein